MVGRGRLGTSLANALGADLGRGRGATEVPAGSLCLLAVPDPEVSGLAARLAGPPGVRFVHCSGALGLDALAPAAAAGHAVGSLHPLQSFPTARPASAFAGILFAVDGSSPALLDELAALAERLGGRWRRVPDAERARYHAAAVVASNYLVVLAAEAAGLLVDAGWERSEAVAALVPLMRGSVEGLAAAGLPGALTGPIRRGDVATVRRHLAVLPAGRSVVYRMLGLAALELALEAGLDHDAGSELRVALTNGGSDPEVLP